MKISIISLIFATFSISFLEASGHKFTGLTRQRHEEALKVFENEVDDMDENFYKRKYLFGDWHGIRTELAKKGITTTSTWSTDLLGNPTGGKSQAFTNFGAVGIDFVANLEQYGYQGLAMAASFFLLGGKDLSEWIGNEFSPTQLLGPPTLQIDTCFLAQQYAGGKGIMLLGRLNAGDHFCVSPLYFNFVSEAFNGNPIAILLNTPFSSWPTATWGSYIDYRFTENVLGKFGYYNANENLDETRFHGFNWTFKSTNGLLFITEWTYLYQTEESGERLPGHYTFGAYYLTGDSCRFLEGEDIGNWGWYFLFDQTVFRVKDDISLTPFIALLFAPGDRNEFPFFMTTGVVWKGMIPCRSDDTAAVGVAYGQYSGDLREKQKNLSEQTQTFELVFELNYRYQVTPWFYVQPDMQYIANPSGYSTIANAWVFGAQTGLVF